MDAAPADEIDDELDTTRAARAPDRIEGQVEHRGAICRAFGDDELLARAKFGRNEQTFARIFDRKLLAGCGANSDPPAASSGVKHRERPRADTPHHVASVDEAFPAIPCPTEPQ